MWRGFTFTQAEPRRPASYGASRRLMITPSCPSAIAASKNSWASEGEDVTSRRTRCSTGTAVVETGQAIGQR